MDMTAFIYNLPMPRRWPSENAPSDEDPASRRRRLAARVGCTPDQFDLVGDMMSKLAECVLDGIARDRCESYLRSEAIRVSGTVPAHQLVPHTTWSVCLFRPLRHRDCVYSALVMHDKLCPGELQWSIWINGCRVGYLSVESVTCTTVSAADALLATHHAHMVYTASTALRFLRPWKRVTGCLLRKQIVQ